MHLEPGKSTRKIENCTSDNSISVEYFGWVALNSYPSLVQNLFKHLIFREKGDLAFLKCVHVKFNFESSKMKRFPAQLIIALSISITACGGNESPTNANNTVTKTVNVEVPASAVGIYDVNFGGFLGVYTLLDDGRFSGIHYVNNFSIVGSPHSNLAVAITSDTILPITWSNFAAGGGMGLFERGSRIFRSVNNGTLTFELSSNDLGTFTAEAKRQKFHDTTSSKTLYFDPIPMPALAGNYNGEGRTVGFQETVQQVNDFLLDSSGNFTLTYGKCGFQGRFVQHGATGVFNVLASSSGGGCQFIGLLNGIVTPISFSENKPRLGLQLTTTTLSHSAVFMLLKK